MGLKMQPTNTAVCEHTGKDMMTKSAAKSCAKRHSRSSKTNIEAYHCPICHKWHVGKMPKRRRGG